MDAAPAAFPMKSLLVPSHILFQLMTVIASLTAREYVLQPKNRYNCQVNSLTE
jgi:hypothetical protein